VNFTVYSTQYKLPTRVDNGFKRDILLCYYGNHYDTVLTERQHEAEVFCQGLLYEMMDKALGIEPKGPYVFRNIGFECWLKELKAQQSEDFIMAQSLLSNYNQLSGYYKKENEQKTEWAVQKSRKKNKNQQLKYQIKQNPLIAKTEAGDDSEDDLQSVLELIEKQEEKQRRIQQRDETEFPALPSKSSFPSLFPSVNKERDEQTVLKLSTLSLQETPSSNNNSTTYTEQKEQTAALVNNTVVTLSPHLLQSFTEFLEDEDDIAFGSFAKEGAHNVL